MPYTLDEAEFKYIHEKKSAKFAFENLVLVKDGFPSKFRFRWAPEDEFTACVTVSRTNTHAHILSKEAKI